MSAVAQLRDEEQSVGFKQVLIATDFSPASERALAYGLAIARRCGSTLSVVHAIPTESREPIPLDPLPRELDRRQLDAEEQMKHLGQKAQINDIEYHLLLDQGPVWDVLSSVIEHQHTDLLVVGTRGRCGLTKLALGSVAEEVLRLATCPVLTVGPNAFPAESGRAEFRQILFATDFGPASAKAFPYALSLAEVYRAKLVLLHMVPPMPSPDLGPAAYGPAVYGAEVLTKWQGTTRDESARKLRKLIPPNTKLAADPEYVVGMDFLQRGSWTRRRHTELN